MRAEHYARSIHFPAPLAGLPSQVFEQRPQSHFEDLQGGGGNFSRRSKRPLEGLGLIGVKLSQHLDDQVVYLRGIDFSTKGVSTQLHHHNMWGQSFRRVMSP